MSEITQAELQAEWSRRAEVARQKYIKEVTLYKLPQDDMVYMGEPPSDSIIRRLIDVLKGDK